MDEANSPLLERYGQPLLLLLGLAVLLGGTVFYLRLPRPTPIEILEPSPIPTPGQLGVYVTGAVLKPGVYFLPPGSRVRDALEAAGGSTEEADLVRVNLAKRVYDEEQIYVPSVGEESPLMTSSAPGNPSANKVNLNTASAQDLEALPGIGPVLAQRIVEYRKANGPFATIEDIMKVPGIGPAIFQDIKDSIFVP